MTYWDWFWQNEYYRMVFGGGAVLLIGVGYFIWKKLEEWYEN